MDATEKNGLVKRMINNIKAGDKVIWMILIILVLISVVAIFSSTSTLAIKAHTTRVAIFWKHLKFVGVCLIMVFTINAIPSLKLFRLTARWGFLGSVALLGMLVANVRIGNFIHVERVNGACRTISLGGFSLAVYEVVKVAMVMYLAWAVHTYEQGKFAIANKLSIKYPGTFGWMSDAKAQRWMYIFLPMMIVMVLILPGSTGSALMIGLVMFVTVLIGGMKFKQLLGMGAVALTGLILLASVHILSSGRVLERMQTAFNRANIELPYPDPAARARQKERIAVKKVNPDDLAVGSKEFKEYKDAMIQPLSAEIALVQGGRLPFGKGPGKSTQKYIVPVMFEDYMFSFIVEEYGLWLGLFVLWMYLELFARGMLIAGSCDNRFAKATVGGLSFLICFQALFHIVVNCNVGLVTGQTLPLISHGRCSFLFFCIAFGIILSVSVKTNTKIMNERKKELLLAQQEDTAISDNEK